MSEVDILLSAGAALVALIGMVGWAAWRSDDGDDNPPVRSSSMIPWGITIAVLGLAGSIGGARLDVSTYSGVVNIDAVGWRTMVFVAGAALFVAGVCIACAGRILTEIRLAEYERKTVPLTLDQALPNRPHDGA